MEVKGHLTYALLALLEVIWMLVIPWNVTKGVEAIRAFPGTEHPMGVAAPFIAISHSVDA